METDAADTGGATAAQPDDTAAAAMPRDAKIVKALLKSMGVEEYEPRVVHLFLELWYRYTVDVLTDAQVYSEHASKPTIDAEDIKLAIQMRVNSSFSQPPPREALMELARSRNKVPLPKSLTGPGLPLPPEPDTLIAANYQLLISKPQTAHQSTEVEEDDDEPAAANPSPLPDQQQPLAPQQKVSFQLAPSKPHQ